MKSAILLGIFLAVMISCSDARIGRSSGDAEHWSVDAFPSPVFKHKNLFIRKPSNHRRATLDRASFGSSSGTSRNRNTGIPYDSIFDRPNFQSHFQSRPLSAYDQPQPQPRPPGRRQSSIPNYQRRQDSGSDLQDLNEYGQPGSPKQRYLMTLAAKLYRHKQAQNEYSNQLLNSFGSNVAPFSKK